MASEQEVAYHRTFLSFHYMDNFTSLNQWERMMRTAREVEEMRNRDPEEFESVRKTLAQALKVNYVPGRMQKPFQRPDQFFTPDEEYVEGYPPDFRVAEIINSTLPPQNIVKNPNTGMLALPVQPRHTVFQLRGQSICMVLMYPKWDQEFEEYATPFELGFSVLCSKKSPFPYTPIVDHSWKVIGHRGRLNQGGISIPIAPNWYRGSFEKAIEAGVPIFVHVPAYAIPDGYSTLNSFDSPETWYVVTTSIDGEILDFQRGGGTNPGLESPWYSPTDFFLAARILANLATKIGAKFVSSIMRKATAKLTNRSILRGATTLLAREAEEKVPKRARLFAKTSETGSSHLPAGEGWTDKFGNVTYSTLGSAEDIALVRYHERVHSFFSPKLNVLRGLRADIAATVYDKSSFLKYLEEALAETYSQLRVNGFKGIPTGIRFPVKEGYVTVRAVVTEAAIGTVIVGGVTYGVYWALSE